MIFRALGVLAGLISASAAAATTLTFDDVPLLSYGIDYEESGFRVYAPSDFDGIGGFGRESLHFDVFGAPYAGTQYISAISGNAFSVTSADIEPYPVYLNGSPLDLHPIGAPANDVRFRGYLGGAEVATAYGSSAIGYNTLTFGGLFSRIDRLEVTGLFTSNLCYTSGPDCVPYDGPDFHFNIDNVDVAAIPLPATAPLLAAGLIGSALALRRRRRAIA